MYVPVASITLIIAAYYVPRVSCDDQCFDVGQVEVGVDSMGADYLPCEPSASTSSCCPLGWTCLSNSLCEPLPGNSTQNHGLTSLYTGFCTDPSWRNETACPKICNNNVTLGADIGNGVVACGNGTFCCYGEGDDQCCSTSSNVFSLGVATDVTTLTNPSPATIPSTTATPTATTVVSRASFTSAVVFTSITSSTTSASAIGSAVAVASTPVASSTLKAGSNRSVAIGTGLGLGAAVGLVVLAGFLFFARRRSMIPFKGPHYVGGKTEMDATASERKGTRVHELTTEARFVELAGESLPVEIGGRHGPRAEMG